MGVTLIGIGIMPTPPPNDGSTTIKPDARDCCNGSKPKPTASIDARAKRFISITSSKLPAALLRGAYIQANGCANSSLWEEDAYPSGVNPEGNPAYANSFSGFSGHPERKGERRRGGCKEEERRISGVYPSQLPKRPR
jgi:hypothetical protein